MSPTHPQLQSSERRVSRTLTLTWNKSDRSFSSVLSPLLPHSLLTIFYLKESKRKLSRQPGGRAREQIIVKKREARFRLDKPWPFCVAAITVEKAREVMVAVASVKMLAVLNEDTCTSCGYI